MSFDGRVYELVKQIPKGKVTTYAVLAQTMGTGAYRAVGQALRRNPDAPYKVPCHRVVASDGSIGGYGGPLAENIQKKIALLEKEGVHVANGKIDLEKYLHRF